MHPPLTLANHPLCRDVVIALKRCHRDASWWGRSFGACNEQKWALDQCLKKQKLFKARANAEKGREERDRLRRRVEKYGHATVNGEGPAGVIDTTGRNNAQVMHPDSSIDETLHQLCGKSW